MHRCKYCGGGIFKALVGWRHRAYYVPNWHVPRPERRVR